MSTQTTEKRYTAQHNGLAGTYHEQYGWQVIDAQPHSVEFRVIANGTKRDMQRWALSLNAR